MGADGLPQFWNARRRRVLVSVTVGDACTGDLGDFGGAVSVGKALTEIDRLGTSS